MSHHVKDLMFITPPVMPSARLPTLCQGTSNGGLHTTVGHRPCTQNEPESAQNEPLPQEIDRLGCTPSRMLLSSVSTQRRAAR